jgi:hypothetical protein
MYTKETVLQRVVPEDSDAGHLLVEGFHIGHLGLAVLI